MANILTSVGIIKRVLIKTGLFKESDLEPFHLKGSGIESLLFASYGSSKSFYLYDEKNILIPPREEDLLSCPPTFLRVFRIEDYAFYPSLSSEGLPLSFSRDELLAKIIGEDKYIYLAKSGSMNPAKILKLYREGVDLGIIAF